MNGWVLTLAAVLVLGCCAAIAQDPTLRRRCGYTAIVLLVSWFVGLLLWGSPIIDGCYSHLTLGR